MAVATGITTELLPTQRGGATGNNTPPGFGLGCVQCVGYQIRWAKLAQCIGQGGHAVATKNACLRYNLGRPASRSRGSTSFGGRNWGLIMCR